MAQCGAGYSPGVSGVDLLSLDGRRGIRCCAEAVQFKSVRRFLRLAKWVYKARGAGHDKPGELRKGALQHFEPLLFGFD